MFSLDRTINVYLHKSFKQVSVKFKTDSYQFSPKSVLLLALATTPSLALKTCGEGENNKKILIKNPLDWEVEENRKQFYNLYHLQIS